MAIVETLQSYMENDNAVAFISIRVCKENQTLEADQKLT